MNDTPQPFTFKAARPAGRTTQEIVQEGMEQADSFVLQQVKAVDTPNAPPRRKRGPNKPKEQGEADELSCFLEIVNRLQALSPATRKRALAALQGLFG